MRLEQLEYITAIAKFGSFRRAAEELHMTQPALSESVRNLERELGLTMVDRHRSGATMSTTGSELMPHMLEVVEAVDRFRSAAGDQRNGSRIVHLGTVAAATVPLLSPTIREFRETHPSTRVEVMTAQQALIHQSLLEGGMDLGLVNYLDGDDMPPEFDTVELLRGTPVACIRRDSPLAARESVSIEELAAEPLIAMRSGYVMHRYVHRLLEGRSPMFSFAADGAEMGKLMVASGLGTAVLPDYSVIGDPLEQRGAITSRPIEGDETIVRLVIQRRLSGTPTPAARDLHRLFVEHAGSAVHS